MKTLYLFALLPLLARCSSSELISATGNSLTYEHDVDHSTLVDVYTDAAARCKAMGLIARNTSTVCHDRCVTTFECIKR